MVTVHGMMGLLDDLMKKFILIIVFIAFFIYPSVGLSSYLVELKNGSTFITNHYWEKKGQIKLYFRGGIVGIEKSLVREIRKSDLPYIKEESRPVKEEEVKAESEYKPESGQEKETGLLSHPEKEAFLKEKMRIATEIETVSAAFMEAKRKKDGKQTDEQWEKLLLLQKELSALSDKVKPAYGGKVPSWWDKDDQM
ncbi:MAG TPA: hypothetical protein VMW78_00175 [Anaerolineae bacterium]|nr:hypothetical protein [Anaerolineae bacterium]